MSKTVMNKSVTFRSAATAANPTAKRAATGGWTPYLRLGAAAPGGLALPAAQPTMAWVYSPRGVCFDDDHVVVADTGNHRVLIWHGLPEAMRQTESARFANQLLPRIAEADEVAQAYLYLMKGGYTTAQLLRVDGGSELC